jgi:hypothetical protein
VHIVPDYPAGLIIEHDGEGTPGLNFNKLLTEIIPAGVSFSTKELFDFFEKLFSTDSQLIQVHHNPKEEFEGQIYHNRRILRDGHTILSTELKKAFHNGITYYNGAERHNSQYKAEATSWIRLPLRRESGYLEEVSINHGLQFKDFQFSQLSHNGTIKRKIRFHNGEFLHDGSMNRFVARHNKLSDLSMSDYMSVFSISSTITENFPAGDNFLINTIAFDEDIFTPVNEVHGITLKDSVSETVVVDEKQSLHFGHVQEDIFTPVNEVHSINFKDSVSETVILDDRQVCHIGIAPMADTQIGNLNHNGSVRRNGIEEHRGKRVAYDRLYAGIRYHHYHNGVYKRNNGIKQNTGALIPVDIA